LVLAHIPERRDQPERASMPLGVRCVSESMRGPGPVHSNGTPAG
jgi:hypothetical protein